MDNFDSLLDAARHFARVVSLAVAALLPIVNPLGSAAICLRLTAGKARDALARLVVFEAFLLLGSALLGAYVLDFFGISIPAVQLASGIVVCAIASPLPVGPDESEAHSHVSAAGASSVDWRPRAFYPLAMPITVGLGARKGNPVMGRAA